MEMPVRDPSANQLRAGLPENSRSARPLFACCFFSFVFAIYLGLLLLSLSLHSLGLKLLVGLFVGQAIGTVFVIAHDAAHGSWTGRPKLDRFIAAIAMLPAWHPYCTWEVEHNKIHHYWTNLKGMDPGYAPLAPEEYGALPPFQKWVQRFYRTYMGLGWYYLIDLWLRVFILGRTRFCKNIPFRRFFIDDSIVLAFVAGQIWLSWRTAIDGAGVAWNLSLSVIFPFIVWNYIFAFFTIQNHTGPNVKWYDNRSEWSFYKTQVESTVHTIAPTWFDLAFLRAFNHSAHHVDTLVPVYRLEAAQKTLEEKFRGAVPIFILTIRNFNQILRDCQLYDYRNHKWLRFPK
jgi:acyl-lipid omega-6 desaturase (Delta-12 desaturase)